MSKLKFNRKDSELLANRVVQYHKNNANYSSEITWRHFKEEGIPKSTIYQYISKYGHSDDVVFRKNPGRTKVVMTEAKVKQVEEYFKANPCTTLAAGAIKFNVSKSYVSKILVHKLGIRARGKKVAPTYNKDQLISQSITTTAATTTVTAGNATATTATATTTTGTDTATATTTTGTDTATTATATTTTGTDTATATGTATTITGTATTIIGTATATTGNATATTAALKCDNCGSWYQKDLQLQDSNVEKLGSISLGTEAQIWDTLAFIYGVSWTSIKKYNSKNECDFLKNPDNLRFCYNCIGLLNDNYNSHLKFEQSSDSSSVVQLLKEFRNYQIGSSEKQIDVQFLSNNLVAAVDRDIKVDLDEDFLLEASEEDPFQTSDGVEIKYEPESTYTEYFSDQNISEQSRCGGSPGLKHLKSRQLVIKTEKLSPEEILRFSNKSNREKKRGKPKKRKRLKTVKNLGNDPSVAEIVKLTEKSPLEKKIITAASNLRPHRTKGLTKKKIINPGLPFEEQVKLVMEKYKDSTKCPRISLKGQFICNVCGKGFKHFGHLKGRHWPNHHKLNEVQKCDLCDKVFKERKHLKAHKIYVHGNLERKYCCELCPFKTYTKSALETHKLVHTDIRQYVCDECGKTFKYDSQFKQHMRYHKEIAEKVEGSYSCKLCGGKKFKHNQSLRKHIATMHPKDEKTVYKCSLCSKQLYSVYILNHHENLHKSNPGFVPRVRTKLPPFIIHGQNTNDKLTDTSPISASESMDISSKI